MQICGRTRPQAGREKQFEISYAVPASARSSSQSKVASPFTSNIAILYLGQTDLLSSVSLPSVST